MCGIAGFQVRNGNTLPLDLISEFQRKLAHRGPDSCDSFVGKDFALIFTRLAIVDIAHGDQPFVSPSGNILVANGEIYNAPELRTKFPDYPYQSESDCEVILPLYETYGAEFVEHLRGMYAIAIADQSQQRLVLARDPFGIKPLYYSQTKDQFAFSSEIGPLVDLGFADRKIDAVAQGELLQLKYVIGSKTALPDVKRVQPGDVVFAEGGRIGKTRQTPSWPRRPPARSMASPRLDRKRLLQDFSQAISESVAVHLRAEAPWCLFYSGGVDSSILLRVTTRVSNLPVRCLTIGYEGRESEDESHHAIQLADSLGVECKRVEMGFSDFWELAPRIAASLDDPMADPAVLPLYMLGRAARESGFKIALSGEGADEIFGGYSRYRRATLPAFLRPRKNRRGVFSSSLSLDRFVGWDIAMNDLERDQEKHWDTRPQVLQAVDVLERLPNCLLIKLDRALMANCVEGRTPFLDKQIVDFARKVPDELKATARHGKRLLRDWLAQEWPDAKPYARKKGFSVPLASWMSPHASRLAKLVASEPGIAAIFSQEEVRNAFEKCHADLQPAWSLLFFALWHSHHILKIDCAGDVERVLSDSAKSGKVVASQRAHSSMLI
jgi:asparagine synthase (glutamine-hydrolysing)